MRLRLIPLALAVLAASCGSAPTAELEVDSPTELPRVVLYPSLDYGDGCEIHNGPEGPYFVDDETEQACAAKGFDIVAGEIVLD